MEIANLTGLSPNTVEDCRVQLSRPVQEGPTGPAPVGAAGSAPHGAPPGAAGPPAVSPQGKRLP